MTKRIMTICLLIGGIFLVLFAVVFSTSSMIKAMSNNNKVEQVVSKITLKDLLTDQNGMYKTNYYNIINELGITEEEANTIMDSLSLNKLLDKIITNDNLSNGELYDLIVEAISNDNQINKILRKKLLLKSSEYLEEIREYLSKQKRVISK